MPCCCCMKLREYERCCRATKSDIEVWLRQRQLAADPKAAGVAGARHRGCHDSNPPRLEALSSSKSAERDAAGCAPLRGIPVPARATTIMHEKLAAAIAIQSQCPPSRTAGVTAAAAAAHCMRLSRLRRVAMMPPPIFDRDSCIRLTLPCRTWGGGMLSAGLQDPASEDGET